MNSEELAEKHKPIIVLHSSEKYFPYDVREWFKNTTVTENGRLLKEGLDAKTLATFDANVPIMYSLAHYESGAVKTVNYFVFFAFNGSKRILGSAPTGMHEADLELMSVELTEEGDVAFYALSTHGDTQLYNMRKGYEEVVQNHPNNKHDELIDYTKKLEVRNGRPVIYSAVNSHAFYGSTGSYLRFYGLGNDVTNMGNEIDGKLINLNTNDDVNSYEGYLAVDNVGDYKSRTDSSNNPKMYKTGIAHYKKIPLVLSWLSLFGFFILPLLPAILLRRRKLWLPILVSFLVFYFQFVLVKVVVLLFGGPLGIVADSEEWWRFLIPFSFH